MSDEQVQPDEVSSEGHISRTSTDAHDEPIRHLDASPDRQRDSGQQVYSDRRDSSTAKKSAKGTSTLDLVCCS